MKLFSANAGLYSRCSGLPKHVIFLEMALGSREESKDGKKGQQREKWINYWDYAIAMHTYMLKECNMGSGC